MPVMIIRKPARQLAIVHFQCGFEFAIMLAPNPERDATVHFAHSLSYRCTLKLD